MSIFGNDLPKRVTQREWSEIRSRIYSKLDKQELEQLEMVFRADMEESGKEAGISQVEYDNAMAWLRTNPKKHDLEESDLRLVERYFTEHLRD